ncbi:MAG: hypothetical protein IPK65_09865 [Gammaproteobacteria bacterium]|nr:hypothetical protein [Gammaproteobacteria bacterium]
MLILRIVFFSALMVLSGCATVGLQPQYHVEVDSLASSEAKEKHTYLLLPGNEGVEWEDLQFQEFAMYLMRALNSQGFIATDKAEDADVAIVLSYGIGDPREHQYSYALPVWGKTGISSSHTYGTATSYGNSVNYSGTTTYTPTYGVTGYTTQIGSVTTYYRYALITGYDFKAFKDSNKQIQLWRTTITSTGSSGDLRQVFPILIGAAIPYLASNTGKKIPVRLYESDEVVRAIKGESPSNANDSTKP